MNAWIRAKATEIQPGKHGGTKTRQRGNVHPASVITDSTNEIGAVNAEVERILRFVGIT